MTYTSISASFNGVDLTIVPGLSILSTDAYKPPKRTLSMSAIARTNNSKVTAGFYTGKQINIRVNIVGANRDVIEAALDTLEKYLQPLEKDLVVRQAGNARRYTATYSDYVLQVSGGSYLEVDLVFETSDRFGYDVNPTQITNQAGLTATYNAFTWQQGGSADVQVPLITIQYTAIGNSGTSQTVTVTNPVTSQALVINRIWTAGETLVIDCKNQTIKVNGTDVNFTGGVLSFGLGTQYFNIIDTFSSRTFNINALVYNRWN